MNGLLISITISDKSLLLHITGWEDANTHILQLLAIYGKVGVKCGLLSSVVFKIEGFESRFIKKLLAAVLSQPEHSGTCCWSSEWILYFILGY